MIYLAIARGKIIKRELLQQINNQTPQVVRVVVRWNAQDSDESVDDRSSYFTCGCLDVPP